MKCLILTITLLCISVCCDAASIADLILGFGETLAKIPGRIIAGGVRVPETHGGPNHHHHPGQYHDREHEHGNCEHGYGHGHEHGHGHGHGEFEKPYPESNPAGLDQWSQNKHPPQQGYYPNKPNQNFPSEMNNEHGYYPSSDQNRPYYQGENNDNIYASRPNQNQKPGYQNNRPYNPTFDENPPQNPSYELPPYNPNANGNNPGSFGNNPNNPNFYEEDINQPTNNGNFDGSNGNSDTASQSGGGYPNIPNSNLPNNVPPTPNGRPSNKPNNGRPVQPSGGGLVVIPGNSGFNEQENNPFTSGPLNSGLSPKPSTNSNNGPNLSTDLSSNGSSESDDEDFKLDIRYGENGKENETETSKNDQIAKTKSEEPTGIGNRHVFDTEGCPAGKKINKAGRCADSF